MEPSPTSVSGRLRAFSKMMIVVAVRCWIREIDTGIRY